MNSAHENLSHSLRFVTAGSVDDGKSTLIGRMLLDGGPIEQDVLQAVSNSRFARTSDDDTVDLALFTDGLESEREQGITIDVAYRYFSCGGLSLVAIDAPGHEQYTRNLVTGASAADAVVVLVDITRLPQRPVLSDVLVQTRRHAAIVRFLALTNVVWLVNKMDRRGYRQDHFEACSQVLREMTQQLGLPLAQVIPASALKGDNVVFPSQHMPWYQGPILLQWLSTVAHQTPQPLQQPATALSIQAVVREAGEGEDSLRGYAAKVQSGTLTLGQKLQLWPSGHSVEVQQLYGLNSEDSLAQAEAGQAVALTLSPERDISRGDVVVDEHWPWPAVTRLKLRLCWLDAQPLDLKRRYLIRIGTATVMAQFDAVERVLDLDQLGAAKASLEVGINDIAEVTLSLARPVTAAPVSALPALARLLVIERDSYRTLAAGVIEEVQ